MMIPAGVIRILIVSTRPEGVYFLGRDGEQRWGWAGSSLVRSLFLGGRLCGERSDVRAATKSTYAIEPVVVLRAPWP
jgi:hypothetical protein